MSRLILIILFIIAVSCGPQRKLQRTYIGQPHNELENEFGIPKTILEQGNEKVYVYEIIKDLKSAEINQGRLSLDPMISPMVEKTERYYFHVKDGLIKDVKLEEEYNR
ncbi:MAG: hypothetical protein JXR61_03425 [Prolixibacteraceae bacterium]|nr:hypothetical protein [Prolixibacteraceae bacterium]